MNNDLLQHHIRETTRQFNEIKDDLDCINTKIDNLHEFKLKLLVNTKWISLIVSAGCGFLTLVVTAIINYLLTKKLGG